MAEEERRRTWRARLGHLAGVRTVATDDGALFIPWTDGHAVGFMVKLPGGWRRFIYLNPSDQTDDGVTNAFLYIGDTGDPSRDTPIHHYDLN